MDKPSTEAAFSLRRSVNGEPVSGSFSWSGNSLLFTPDKPLTNSRNYTATEGTSAQALGGGHLSVKKSWQFTTAPYPLIAAVVPADNAAGVSPSAVVVVAFDSAMDKPSAEAAFSLKRSIDGTPVSGSFGWYGNALLFKPNPDLAARTRYTATVSRGAKDLAGHPLPLAMTWRFTTRNP